MSAHIDIAKSLALEQGIKDKKKRTREYKQNNTKKRKNQSLVISNNIIDALR